ncbi:NADPH-dependent 2,4-dienoyl-CoA reductase/sulfur reductase-like enzyme [Arthrobacter pascens]|uniref:FAD-dependent oxidoreductase n=1 Tax=Arthrobacter pascens TaxID=1677 RepID=UPI00277F31AB|nr:FAD-dependent oxidoreductase [Arthrobacter pascens]MDQ0632259.1 NADPH-dependent 2,4-dienoyl-CoA reductase/sulfur reductase-like enzyme [Arthrobacter pascens]
MQTLAIVGASLAGISAARAARARGFAGRLVIIGDEPHRPYDRPPLSKDFLAGKISVEHLGLESPYEAERGDPLQAEWLGGAAACCLDAAARTVKPTDGREIEADGVVIATGASARILPVLAGLANVFTLRTLDDAQYLGSQLIPGVRLVIVGAGFIGAEVASTARTLGADVTVVSSESVPLSRPFGVEMAAEIARLHGINGVELICDAAIDSYDVSEGEVSGLRLEGGRYLPADVVLVVEIEAGDPAAHNFLAVYLRGSEPLAVLGANQTRLFTKWRRQLNPARPAANQAAVVQPVPPDTWQTPGARPVLAPSFA